MAQVTDERAHLHEMVESLTDLEMKAAANILRTLKQDALYADLAASPGVRVPPVWPPKFVHVDPVPYKGDEPPSEELIRLRR